ncbi:MAG TPA: hypothetical protein VFW22_10985 [Pseudolabrys sp.]|nr:hypothetical protein [Pseudolabrys sp.]
MNRLLITRFVSVLAGAAVLFWGLHGLEMAFYIALPIAIVAYVAVKVGVGLLIGADKAI